MNFRNFFIGAAIVFGSIKILQGVTSIINDRVQRVASRQEQELKYKIEKQSLDEMFQRVEELKENKGFIN